MTAEDVAASMSDIDPNSLPEGLAAYWDFEKEAEDYKTFKSVGKLSDIAAGMHNYAANGGEGQGAFSWIEADYTSGCPFVSGTAFPVVTTPSWKAKKGIVESSEGNDTAGSASILYNYGGDYTVTLTLANSLGSDERTFGVIKVTGDNSSVEGINAEEIATYAVDGMAVVEFAEAGKYDVRMYTSNGQKVAENAIDVAAGGVAKITMGTKGVYILTVEKDGKLLKSVKLLNK
jgi:hypothetical protein